VVQGVIICRVHHQTNKKKRGMDELTLEERNKKNNICNCNIYNIMLHSSLHV
jgi:hypothetical protein